MSTLYIKYPASGGGVTTINGLSGDVTLAAGTGITITPSGNTLTIAATGTPSFPILAPNGTMLAPSYSFAASTSTGMYSPATNFLALTSNGATALVLSDTQVVSISNNGTASLPILTNNTRKTGFFFSGETIGISTNQILAATIDASQNLNVVGNISAANFPGSFIVNGGNSLGTDITIGTNDTHSFSLITRGNIGLTLDTTPGTPNTHVLGLLYLKDQTRAGSVILHGDDSNGSDKDLTFQITNASGVTLTMHDNLSVSGPASIVNTNSGDVTIGSPSAASDSNGLLLSGAFGQILNLEYADATHPGGVSATTQTFGGDKTFAGALIGGLSPSTDVTSSAITGAVNNTLNGAISTVQLGVLATATRTITTSQTDTNRITAAEFQNIYAVPTGQTLTQSTGTDNTIRIDALSVTGGGSVALHNASKINIVADSLNTGTRKIGILISKQSGSTANADIADNIGFGAGSFFINSTQNNPSLFSGQHTINNTLTIAGDGSNTGFNVSASNVVTIGTGTATTHVLNTQLGTNAAGVLTLLNGPAGTTGNATGYIQININGVNRFIPFW